MWGGRCVGGGVGVCVGGVGVCVGMQEGVMVL